MAVETKPIAETNNFIVLDRYDTIDQAGATYQTEADLENELIKDLSYCPFSNALRQFVF